MTALKRWSKRFHRERSRSGVFALEIAKNHLSLLYKSSLHFTNILCDVWGLPKSWSSREKLFGGPSVSWNCVRNQLMSGAF